MSICAVSIFAVLTETPGMTAPMQANILPPTFQASWPPPQGSETSAPGKVRQMALTMSRLIASLWPGFVARAMSLPLRSRKPSFLVDTRELKRSVASAPPRARIGLEAPPQFANRRTSPKFHNTGMDVISSRSVTGMGLSLQGLRQSDDKFLQVQSSLKTVFGRGDRMHCGILP